MSTISNPRFAEVNPGYARFRLGVREDTNMGANERAPSSINGRFWKMPILVGLSDRKEALTGGQSDKLRAAAEEQVRE
jgi:hypothetical protein